MQGSLRNISHTSDDIHPDIHPSERISRYVLEPKHLKADGRVSSQVFKPQKQPRETSVYRTTECNDAEVWELGDKYVAPLRQKSVLGRADLIVQNVVDQKLSVVSVPDPHPRHAAIRSWPDDQEKILLITKELAKRARVISREH